MKSGFLSWMFEVASACLFRLFWARVPGSRLFVPGDHEPRTHTSGKPFFVQFNSIQFNSGTAPFLANSFIQSFNQSSITRSVNSGNQPIIIIITTNNNNHLQFLHRLPINQSINQPTLTIIQFFLSTSIASDGNCSSQFFLVNYKILQEFSAPIPN